MLPESFDDKTVTWSSSNAAMVSVNTNGVAQAVNINTGGATTFVSGPGIATVTITASAPDVANYTITVVSTTEAIGDIMSLPPLKDQFKDYFLIGNIFRSGNNPQEVSGTGADARIVDDRLTRHFNAITAENHMKPGYLVTGHAGGSFSWDTNNRNIADNFVDAAINSGMKVIGHTLLWHSQNANWMWEQIASRGNSGSPTVPGAAIATKEQALIIMRGYINEVASRYKEKIYVWDVLNEIFPDNASRTNAESWKTQMRSGKSGEGQAANPWYVAIGYEFVYEGFLAARKADPNAILYYNDYNTEMSTRRQLIFDMVKYVNDKYLAGSDKPAGEAPNRLLIEGIGMQEHHNNGVPVANIKASIDLFRTLGVELSVTELDIIAYANYGAFSSAGGAGTNRHDISSVTNQALVTQANLYNNYMKLYIDNKDIIKRVSIWGLTDNVSWRSRGLPVLFDHNNKAKPAYYRFVGALD